MYVCMYLCMHAYVCIYIYTCKYKEIKITTNKHEQICMVMYVKQYINIKYDRTPAQEICRHSASRQDLCGFTALCTPKPQLPTRPYKFQDQPSQISREIKREHLPGSSPYWCFRSGMRE